MLFWKVPQSSCRPLKAVAKVAVFCGHSLETTGLDIEHVHSRLNSACQSSKLACITFLSSKVGVKELFCVCVCVNAGMLNVIHRIKCTASILN